MSLSSALASTEASVAAFLELCCETASSVALSSSSVSDATFGHRPIPPLAVTAYALLTALHFESLEEFEPVNRSTFSCSSWPTASRVMVHRPTGKRYVVKPVRIELSKHLDRVFISPIPRCSTQKTMPHDTIWLPNSRLLNTVYTVLDCVDEHRIGTTPPMRHVVSEYRPCGNLADLVDAQKNEPDASNPNCQTVVCLPEDTVRFYVAQLALLINVFVFTPGQLTELTLNHALLDDDTGYMRYNPPTGIRDNYSLEEADFGCTGSMASVPPEVFARGVEDNPASLYWVLGCLMVKLATGKPAFAGHTIFELARQIMQEEDRRSFPEIEQRWEAMHDLVIKGLLVNDPDRRLQSLADLQAHPFFDGFDWDALQREEMRAPSGVLSYLAVRKKKQADREN